MGNLHLLFGFLFFSAARLLLFLMGQTPLSFWRAKPKLTAQDIFAMQSNHRDHGVDHAVQNYIKSMDDNLHKAPMDTRWCVNFDVTKNWQAQYSSLAAHYQQRNFVMADADIQDRVKQATSKWSAWEYKYALPSFALCIRLPPTERMITSAQTTERSLDFPGAGNESPPRICSRHL